MRPAKYPTIYNHSLVFIPPWVQWLVVAACVLSVVASSYSMYSSYQRLQETLAQVERMKTQAEQVDRIAHRNLDLLARIQAANDAAKEPQWITSE